MHGFDMVRRSPAERARHHARAVIEEPSTTSSRLIVTTTVVVHASATAKTSATTSATSTKPVLTTTSSVVTTSTSLSTTTSTTPSTTTTLPTTTSTSATPATTSTISSSSVVPTSRALTTSSTTSSSSSATPIPSDASNAASTTTQKSSGLSGAATGGIVAASVLAAAAILIFVIRKTFIQRRKRKRNTWGAGMYPAYTDKIETLDLPPPVPEKVLTPMTAGSFAAGAPSPRTPVWAAPRPESIVRSPVGAPMGNIGNGYQQLSPPQMQMPQHPQQNAFFITPPPVSYNNPVDDVYGGVQSGMTPGASMASIAPAKPASPSVETAIVRVVYIPSLPDELSITVGETVRVIKAFDDGWALCSNVRGEQGVVPVECLDRNASAGSTGPQTQTSMAQSGSSVGHGQENGSDWRSMKRISSLSTQQPHY